MKTFYERFRDRIDRSDNSAVLFEDEYKAIQLDALMEAAEIACDSQKYYTRSASIQCLQIHDAVLSRIRELEADTKKEGR